VRDINNNKEIKMKRRACLNKKTPITNDQAKVLLPLQQFIANGGERVFDILVEDHEACVVVYNFDQFQNALRLISICSTNLSKKFQYDVERKVKDITGNELTL